MYPVTNPIVLKSVNQCENSIARGYDVNSDIAPAEQVTHARSPSAVYANNWTSARQTSQERWSPRVAAAVNVGPTIVSVLKYSFAP